MKLNVSKRISLFSAIGVLALVAGIAAVSLGVGTEPASSAKGDAEVTIRKWMIGEGPQMMGVVGGDVGSGTFTGEVVTIDPTAAKGNVTEIEAIYNVDGSDHNFTAHIHATVYKKTGTAYVRGMVVDGWMAGARIDGEFKTTKCNEGTCFEVVLRLLAGTIH